MLLEIRTVNVKASAYFGNEISASGKYVSGIHGNKIYARQKPNEEVKWYYMKAFNLISVKLKRRNEIKLWRSGGIYIGRMRGSWIDKSPGVSAERLIYSHSKGGAFYINIYKSTKHMMVKLKWRDDMARTLYLMRSNPVKTL